MTNAGNPLIDMRLRPSFLNRFFGAVDGTAEADVVRWVNRRVGSRDVEHFNQHRDVDSLLGAMDDAGIDIGVMVGRSTPTVRIPNDRLSDIAARAKGRLIGVASIDPNELAADGATAEARRAVRELGLRGINVDPGFYEPSMRADDHRLMPLYEACVELGVPLFVMSGPTTPNLADNDPLAVDVVARNFRTLPIVCCHAFYPNVDAMLGVAFRNENVYVSPDMYVFAPGAGRYIEAANGFLRDQFLFGSSYPFRPLRQSVEDFRNLGLTPEALEAATTRNPARLLGL